MTLQLGHFSSRWGRNRPVGRETRTSLSVSAASRLAPGAASQTAQRHPARGALARQMSACDSILDPSPRRLFFFLSGHFAHSCTRSSQISSECWKCLRWRRSRCRTVWMCNPGRGCLWLRTVAVTTQWSETHRCDICSARLLRISVGVILLSEKNKSLKQLDYLLRSQLEKDPSSG